MYGLSSCSHPSGSLRCPLNIPVVLGMYVQCACDAFKFKEGRRKPHSVFKMFCWCSVALQCICFSLLSSEANLLSIDDSDGPFSPNEERKVTTVYW